MLDVLVIVLPQAQPLVRGPLLPRLLDFSVDGLVAVAADPRATDRQTEY